MAIDEIHRALVQLEEMKFIGSIGNYAPEYNTNKNMTELEMDSPGSSYLNATSPPKLN